MMESWIRSDVQLAELMQTTAVAVFEEALQGGAAADLPPYLRDWLGRLRLLYGVPFSYLVPNDNLLPKESIRFFYLDRNWVDRLVDGALSVGKTSTRDYAHHHAVNTQVRARLDDEEQAVRRKLRGLQELVSVAYAEDLTGFILRSSAVAGWPGLEVKASKGAAGSTKLRLLRMERLAPDVLLCIFSDIPTRVDIEEPREGLQFGVDLVPTSAARSGFAVQLRYLRDQVVDGAQRRAGEEVERSGGGVTNPLPVPVRREHRRVVHVELLRQRLEQELRDAGVDMGPGNSFSPAEFAIQMLQFPYRQRFEGDGQPRPGSTRPSLHSVSIYEAATFKINVVQTPLSVGELSILFPGLDG